jgi:low temperature requirement protein LtrA
VQPSHFVERHGLIVIIAIGESLVAIGLGARSTALGLGVIVAAVLGLLVATSFWLAYFDFFTIRAEQLLADREGVERVALARDAFTYLHLPMVTGIVLFAFAMKTTLAHVVHALVALALVAAVWVALHVYELVWWREERARTRARRLPASAG